MTWRLPEPYFLIAVFTFVPLLPVRAAVMEINRIQAPGAWSNSRASLGDLAVVIGSWLLTLGVFLGTLTLAPGSFKASYAREFTNSCTEASVGNGALVSDARPVCACTAQHFADHHTATELMWQSWKASSHEIQKGLADATETCGQRFKAQFRASYLSRYTKSCRQVALGRGSPEAEAGPWCACMAQHFVEHHTPGQLSMLDVDPNSPETREETATARNGCLQQFFLRNFTNSCTQGAVSQGSVEAEIKPICSCIAKHLVDNHTPAELTAFDSKAASPELQKEMTQSAAACREG